MRQSDIYDVVFLENTRLIYSGINLLYELWGKETLGDYVKKQWQFCIEHQNNPLYPFFDFLREEKKYLLPSESEDFCETETKHMLSFFHDITNLQSERQKDCYPELFEALCNSMRDIMDSQICYLLYSQRDQIQLLSMSSFPDDMIQIPEEQNDKNDRSSIQLGQADFNELRNKIHSERKMHKHNIHWERSKKHWSVADTLYAPQMRFGQNIVVMVLDYPKYPATEWKGEWIYIVFQYKKAVPERATLSDTGPTKDLVVKDNWHAWNQLLINSRNLLFMRSKILDQCMEKLYILLVSQRSYQYVLPFSTDAEVITKERISPSIRPTSILHLTDLHLSSRNKYDAIKFLNEYKWKELGPVDLVVITGDIIQASNVAGILEQHYQIADKFVRTLAVKLWSDSKQNVRADWRKRIMIIPGNHDYASMNELQSMSIPGAKRATCMGYPARKEGGPMVKFAYYIKFISGLLGIDMNELVDNELHEVRCYYKMGVVVFGLNTVSGVSPHRTNKVMINMDTLKKLISVSDASGQFPLVLCHHGPAYSPNYLMDRYAIWKPGITKTDQVGWINDFHQQLKQIEIWAKSKASVDLDDVHENLEKLRKNILGKGFSESNPGEYDLLWDITCTINALDQKYGFSEQVSALLHSLNGDAEMAKLDKERMGACFSGLLTDVKYRLSLCGHTHNLDAWKGPNLYKDFPADFSAVPYVEGDQMFKNKTVNFGLLSINHSEGKIVWTEKNEPKKPSERTETWEYS